MLWRKGCWEGSQPSGPAIMRGDKCSDVTTLSPFLIGRMFLREASWKYSAKLVGS